jgi:uncharacterized CHY-type Zn-finger protein
VKLAHFRRKLTVTYVRVKFCLKYYSCWKRVKNSTIVWGDITQRGQTFDKKLDYCYVTSKYDGSLAVQWLVINICNGMENRITITGLTDSFKSCK